MTLSRTVRRHATTIAISVLAAGLGVYLYVDRDAIRTGEQELRKDNLVPAWRPDELDTLSWTKDDASFSLTRQPADEQGNRAWDILIDGKKHGAEEQVVDQLMTTLEFARVERRVPDDSIDREAFGLTSPRATLKLSMGELTFVVRFGRTAPTPPGSRYVEVEGHGVAVITEKLYEALSVEPATLRSKNFVPYFSIDLAEMRIQGDGGDRHFVRASWNGGRGAGFRFADSATPANARVRAGTLDKVWFNALGKMEVLHFLPTEEANSALDKKVQLELKPNDQRPVGRIEIGGPCPDHPEWVVAIRREPDLLAGCVDRAVLDALSIPADRFIDRAAIGAGLDEVAELTLKADGNVLDVARAGSGWRQREPTGRDLDPVVARDFVHGLLEVEGDLIPKPANFKAWATLKVIARTPSPLAEGGTFERIEEVEVAKPSDEQETVVVHRKEDGAYLAIPTAFGRRFSTDGRVLRSPEVFDHRLKAWSSLVVQTPTRTQRISRTELGLLTFAGIGGGDEPLDGEPAVKTPALPVDQQLTSELVGQVGDMRAIRWEAGGELSTYGLDKPTRSVWLRGFGVEAEEQRIDFGAAAAGGYFARSSAEETIFVAPARVVDALDGLLVDRNALAVEVDRVTTIDISWPAGKVMLRPVGGVWETEPTSAGSKQRAATLRDALGSLRASRAVTAPATQTARFGFAEPVATFEVTLKAPESMDGTQTYKLVIGGADVVDEVDIRYARRSDVDAVFALPQSQVEELRAALSKDE